MKKKHEIKEMPQENIHAIAHLHARPDKTDELNALLTSLLEPTREETGCIRFELLQNRQSPTEFAIVSTWHNEQAVQHPACQYRFTATLTRRILSSFPVK
jgi:quinol monooxygenase YgiN